METPEGKQVLSMTRSSDRLDECTYNHLSILYVEVACSRQRDHVEIQDFSVSYGQAIAGGCYQRRLSRW